MPVISRFYGIIVKMYFRQTEHNPPHFHVVSGEYIGVFDITTLEMINGDLPQKERKLVETWAKGHQTELLQIWNTQEFITLPPLA